MSSALSKLAVDALSESPHRPILRNYLTVAAREFRAEFVRAVCELEGFPGPRILQLDAYKKADCSN